MVGTVVNNHMVNDPRIAHDGLSSNHVKVTVDDLVRESKGCAHVGRIKSRNFSRRNTQLQTLRV